LTRIRRLTCTLGRHRLGEAVQRPALGEHLDECVGIEAGRLASVRPVTDRFSTPPAIGSASGQGAHGGGGLP
jgi:hypothetical protein